MNLSPFRRPKGFLKTVFSRRDRVDLISNLSLEDEAFASLEFVSEIEDVGIDFLQRQGAPTPVRTFGIFRSLIRQSRTFYDAARKLHYRASALIYYYSFLNLAKAYICISNPQVVSQRIQHGISTRGFRKSKFQRQTITIPGLKGVFQEFYYLQMGSRLPISFKLNIASLLGYCSDVSHEYSSLGYGKRKVFRVMGRILTDHDSKHVWPCLAIQNFEEVVQFKKSFQLFHEYFEPTEMDQRFVRDAFGLSASSSKAFAFFQSRDVLTYDDPQSSDEISAIRKDVLRVFGTLLVDPVYLSDEDFKLSLPLRLNNQIPMNDILAQYGLFFYIGSLVRYHPEYLEELLDSEAAWIIERFVHSSGVTLLLSMTNLILNKNYIYTRH